MKKNEFVVLEPSQTQDGCKADMGGTSRLAVQSQVCQAKGHYTEGAELIDSVLDTWD